MCMRSCVSAFKRLDDERPYLELLVEADNSRFVIEHVADGIPVTS